MMLQRLQAGIGALSTLRHNPVDPVAGQIFAQSLDYGLHCKLLRAWRTHAEGRWLLVKRPRLDSVSLDLASLGRLPTGTLGQTYAAYFERMQLAPLAPWTPPRSDVEYVAVRVAQSHDLWHIVTGYGTDPVGELELQAFILGNLRALSSLVALFAGGKYLRQANVRRQLLRAYRRGRTSRPLDSVPWEMYWPIQADQICALLCSPSEKEDTDLAISANQW